MFSSATQPPPCDNFVVSAITFEWFKLRSLNWIHALLIQISRTSSIIDIVVPFKMTVGGHFFKKSQKQSCVSIGELWSKVIFGHPNWSIWNGQKCVRKLFLDIQTDQSEMSRIAIESEFLTSKWLIDLKWPEMPSKVIFEHPKCLPPAILSKIPYLSKMARNAIESEFRTSKMADGSNFVKISQKKLSRVSIWNGQKCDQKWISDTMVDNSLYVKNYKLKKSWISIWNGQKCHLKWISDIRNGRWCIKFQKIIPYWSKMYEALLGPFRSSH